jgi:repressor LexA
VAEDDGGAKVRGLTEQQECVLRAIVAFHKEHGYMPTMSEIGKATNLASKSTVHRHIANLRVKGYLTGAGRSMRVLRP